LGGKAEENSGFKKNSWYSTRLVLISIFVGENGSVPEWLMGADCKSAGYAYAGSNPARPTPTEVEGKK
jgi:hypothetical protein